jgi:ABC-type antimicrobial peptide transport system permease subunit
MSIIGCFFGTIFGCVLVFLINYYPNIIINVHVSYWAILLSVGISFLIGIIFGGLPAFMASKLTPISCLRRD